MNNFYALYRFRKGHTKYPKDYVQVHTEQGAAWLIMGRTLDDPEIEFFDLEYRGERMRHEQCLEEIKRISLLT